MDSKEVKICKKCELEQNLSNFNKHPQTKDKYHPVCKGCMSKANKIFNAKFKDKKQESNKKSYHKNIDSIKEKRKIYNKLNKEKAAKYTKDNKQRFLPRRKEYILKNKDKIQKYLNNYVKERYKNDIEFRIKAIWRTRIYNVLKNKQRYGNSKTLVGCSTKEYRDYIEKQLLPGWTWENYGTVWEIDHKEPCSKFDLTKQEEQFKCFHYINTQPMLISDNRKKYNK